MIGPRVLGGGAALLAMVALLVVGLASGPSQQGQRKQPDQQPAGSRTSNDRPIPMPRNPVAVEIALGLNDEQPTRWDGTVQVSEGHVVAIDVVGGGAKAKAEGNRFRARSVRRMMTIVGPKLRVSLDAPATATVTVQTPQGEFQFTLADLAGGTAKMVLNGRASVEKQEAALRLTGAATEDDYPAMAKAGDGTVWLAYVAYQPGKPILNERIQAGHFESLVPSGNGDQIRLMHFDGKVWHPAVAVTDRGLDVWRPAVAVDGKGRVVVAWSQQVDGDWEIFYRRYTPGGDSGGRWSESVRLTHDPGSDFQVVAATDSAGTVWLAWQAWRDDNFEILLAALEEGHPWREPRALSRTRANDWSPAIATDSKGNVYVAYDTYEKGNYDVRLHRVGKEARTWIVAGSAKFEARPHLACDGKDRLWIAYEEGDEQWGKDYANEQFRRIGLQKNPGYALYIHRTIQVKCLVDGRLLQPAADLQQALADRLKHNKSLPRLAVDSAGGIWLLFRHHPLPDGLGEVWDSYALHFDGRHWSAPRHLAHSSNLLDNRPALVPLEQGILAVHSSDSRVRTQNRDQNDLFATILTSGQTTYSPELVPVEPPAEPRVPVVHPQEAADIARIRSYRIKVGDKPLHLWRGEFHRHTEISAHRDADGLLEDAWRYALDAAGLDWIGVGDHDNGFGSEYMWWLMQKTTDLYHNPPRFVGVHTYERSVVYPNGHRNVIMPRRGIRPLPRGDLKGTPEKGSPDTKLLYAYLKHFGGICASHTSATNMGTDWRDNSAAFEPVVEIYQGHRHNYEHFGAPRSPTEATQIGGYQPAGFVWNALEKGYRLGFECSSDHISTHMSYAVLLTDDISRQGVVDAFRKRHSYGATDNIILVVRSGEHLMGDEFTTGERPTLDIVVHGTAAVAKVHIIRDNKYVYSTEPKEREVQLRYTDMAAAAGQTSYYYVRIEQSDGNLAWASPLWITYKP